MWSRTRGVISRSVSQSVSQSDNQSVTCDDRGGSGPHTPYQRVLALLNVQTKDLHGEGMIGEGVVGEGVLMVIVGCGGGEVWLMVGRVERGWLVVGCVGMLCQRAC